MDEIEKWICTCCLKEKKIGDFYISDSPIYKGIEHLPVCKNCLVELAEKNKVDEEYDLNEVKNVLRQVDRPFLLTLWNAAVQEHKSSNFKKNTFKLLMKNLVMPVHRYLTWADSDSENKFQNNDGEYEHTILDKYYGKNQDKNDVLRILGYDPFEYETDEDKRQLYSRLLDFLDESTLEDGLKLQSSIEIVKGFNQIDKINTAITRITSDINNVASNSTKIKSLVDTKKNISTSILALAKDNGISVNYNNSKSKGGGTLSGIIKQLQEKGFEEAAVNLFDIETCDGMRQVADISNESIMKQLQFDENDYTSMVLEQREIIGDLTERIANFEEENRKLKKQIIKNEAIE